MSYKSTFYYKTDWDSPEIEIQADIAEFSGHHVIFIQEQRVGMDGVLDLPVITQHRRVIRAILAVNVHELREVINE